MEKLANSSRIEDASAKIRTGNPKDELPDYDLPIWAGIVLPKLGKIKPVADILNSGIDLPTYLQTE